MPFLLIFRGICSSLLVNQDNRKANRGSNGLANQSIQIIIKGGLDESSPYIRQTISTKRKWGLAPFSLLYKYIYPQQ